MDRCGAKRRAGVLLAAMVTLALASPASARTTPAEVAAANERTIATLFDARLLHPGANTISRWESGRNVQTEAMEMLLRLIRDLPGSLDYLRRHAA